MSRVGKQPIPVPKGVTVTLKDGVITVKGPKGELSFRIHPEMRVIVEEGVIRVERPSDRKIHRALHGTTRQIIANMIHGVTQGYEKVLKVVGKGYRVQQRGKDIVFNVGFAHEVVFTPPPDVQVTVEGQDTVRVSGIDKQRVGQVAANIRAIRPPDPYKGKGIRYEGEVLILKPGKAGVKA